MFVLTNARLIPELTEGFDGAMADVVVNGSRIEALFPAGSRAFAGAETFDLAGKTLLPGMFDLHMHLYFSSSNFAAVALRSHNDYLFDSIAYAHEMLEQGYTTIRDCGNVYYIGIALRDAVNGGVLPGPRILASGMCLSPAAKGNDTFPNLYYEVNSPDEILTACRKEYAKGVDFIKYMGTGSVANLTGVPGALVSSRRELFALQEAVEALGTYAAVHCHGVEGIRLCVEAGIRTVEHASMIDGAAIDLILQKGGKSALVPTLTPVVQMHRGEDCGNTDPRVMAKIDEVYACSQNLVQAARAGVLTGWGTDVSMSFFKAHPGYEFGARREMGFTNLEMLRQATIESARIVGLENELGSIKAGKLADLVAIDGKPDEQIDVMFQKPFAVWKEGKLCKKGA